MGTTCSDDYCCLAPAAIQSVKSMDDSEDMEDGEIHGEGQANKVELNFNVSVCLSLSLVSAYAFFSIKSHFVFITVC